MLQVLTEDQVNALLSAPDHRTREGRRDRAFLHILGLGGLRIAEACNLKVTDIEKVGEEMFLTFTGKKGKTRTVALPSRAVSAVERHLTGHKSPFVFPGYSGPLTSRAGYNIVLRHARDAGLPDWVHPHSLRHTYGTRLMRATGDLFLVSRVMGHSSTQTTAQYYLAYDRSYASRASKAVK